jgi:hypothetical protein
MGIGCVSLTSPWSVDGSWVQTAMALIYQFFRKELLEVRLVIDN